MLNIADNSLNILPRELCHLSNLCELHLEGNNINKCVFSLIIHIITIVLHIQVAYGDWKAEKIEKTLLTKEQNITHTTSKYIELQFLFHDH